MSERETVDKAMTVKQLIAMLHKLPATAVVYYYDPLDDIVMPLHAVDVLDDDRPVQVLLKPWEPDDAQTDDDEGVWYDGPRGQITIETEDQE